MFLSGVCGESARWDEVYFDREVHVVSLIEIVADLITTDLDGRTVQRSGHARRGVQRPARVLA